MRYYIESNVSGNVYQELVLFCLARAKTVLFVAGDYAKESCKKFLALCLEFGGIMEQRSEWPGTIWPNGNFLNVYQIPVSKNIIKKILEVPSTLSWRLPEYPEDLCFLRSNGEPIYYSVTREGYATIDLPDNEIEEWNKNQYLKEIKIKNANQILKLYTCYKTNIVTISPYITAGPFKKAEFGFCVVGNFDYAYQKAFPEFQKHDKVYGLPYGDFPEKKYLGIGVKPEESVAEHDEFPFDIEEEPTILINMLEKPEIHEVVWFKINPPRFQKSILR